MALTGGSRTHATWVRLLRIERRVRGAGDARGARGAGDASRYRACDPGNHVDVAARWLEQLRCHIDVAGCGGRCGAGGAGGAGGADEVPTACARGARSVQSPGLSLPKGRTHATGPTVPAS